MAVNQEMWQPVIIEQLFKSNQFLRYAYNADEYVIGGAVVHIPQAGSPSVGQRNRSSLPATVSRRVDTDIVYALDEFTSDPSRISDRDKVELSYDKTTSVVRTDTAAIRELAGDWMLYNWDQNIPAGSKILTTGAAATGTAPGATGNRKILTEADIRKARLLLNNQNVPQENRYMLLPSNMLDMLMSDNSLKYAFQQTVDLKEGVIARLYGFDLIERSTVAVQATGGTAGTVKAPGAATATTDDDCALFWQMDCVERALGTVKIFERLDDPTYYGDIYSFLIRAGGRNRRTDNYGVGLIVAAP